MANRRDLSTQDAVRTALAWVWREIEADRMPIPKGKALIYGALSISQVLRDTDLERRLEALEALGDRQQ